MIYINKSSTRTDIFRKLAGRLILMDNRIKWNGWYNMLLILLALKRKVEEYYKKYKDKLKKDLLSRKD